MTWKGRGVGSCHFFSCRGERQPAVFCRKKNVTGLSISPSSSVRPGREGWGCARSQKKQGWGVFSIRWTFIKSNLSSTIKSSALGEGRHHYRLCSSPFGIPGGRDERRWHSASKQLSSPPFTPLSDSLDTSQEPKINAQIWVFSVFHSFKCPLNQSNGSLWFLYSQIPETCLVQLKKGTTEEPSLSNKLKKEEMCKSSDYSTPFLKKTENYRLDKELVLP